MKFNYGGQAVIEGVMMRGQRQMAVAVRNPEGEIILKTEPLKAKIYTSRIMKWPLLRGLVMLWDMLVLGIQSLTWSANISAAGMMLPTVMLASIDSIEETRVDGASDNSLPRPVEETTTITESEELPGWLMTLTILFSLSFSVGLFIVLPAFIAGVANEWFIHDHLISNLFVEGGVRIAILVGYLWLVGFMPDMRRVFQYHGAEHKAVNAYEAGAPLTTESVQSFTTVHTRCGTNFLLLVVVFAIVIFSFLFTLLGSPPMWITLPLRIVLVPLVAAIAYEYIKWSAAHYSNPLVRLVMKPGLALQKLTTRQPDNSMAEVAIVALERVLLADDKVTPTYWDEQRRRLPVRPAQPETVRGESSVAA
jgi:uncharacterized protein YqhQ